MAGSDDRTTKLPDKPSKPDDRTTPLTGRTTPLPPPGPSAPTKDLENATTIPLAPSQTSSPSTTFKVGELVAGRYQIMRFIGRGGMGEVYEAEDQELGESVALKTVRPEIAEDRQAIQRFKREIQLARKITHPNVSRIFDLGYHARPAPQPGITFLTMELLRGETLAQRLNRTGPLGTHEVLPLAIQMGAGLAAAHQAGIVHRDFKSANVMLVPAPGAEGGVRAVITDFGLALYAAADAGSSAGAATAGIVGTPAYMAPEQVEGKKVTPATDIYAFGTVLYEMVTGKWPFYGETPLVIAVKRLKEPPQPPRSHVPDLDPKWEATILHCLERKPGDRFPHAEEVVRALRGEAIARRRPAWQTPWLVAAAVLIVTIAAFVAYRLRRKHVVQPAATTTLSELPPIPSTLRRSVAVLGFKNLSRNAKTVWLSTALSEMLTTELGTGGALRTISGEDVARMKLSLSLPSADSFARDTLERIGANLGANLVVLGSYLVVGNPTQGEIRLDLSLQDTNRGITIASVSETGSVTKLLALVSKAGTDLRKEIGIGKVSAAESEGVRAAAPSSPEAARYYSEGLDQLRLYDALAAKDLLQKAVAAEPKFPLAHAALARAWSDLGYDAQAEQEAKTALDLSRGLVRKDRLLVEARYEEMSRQLPKAAETYRSLWQFFPDNLEYGLSLASVLWKSGKASEALQVTAALEKLPAPEGGDPRIDIARSAASGALGNFKGELESAAAAARKADALGARIQSAIAKRWQCMAEDDLSQPKQAIADCEQAKQTFTALGDQYSVANTLLDVGNIQDHLGNPAQAKSTFEQALAVFRRVGNENGVANCLNNIGVVLTDQGDYKGAISLAQQSLALAQKIGRKDTGLNALNNVASVYYNQGDYPEAFKTEQQYLDVAREIGDKASTARALMNLGLILSYQGKAADSLAMFEQALAAWREIGTKREIAAAFGNIGNALYEQGKVAEAGKNYKEALDLTRQVGERSDEALRLQNLANALYDEGDLKSSKETYEKSLTLSETMGYKQEELATLNALGDVSLDEGRFDEANKNYEAAGAIAHSQKSLADITMNHVNLARVLLATGQAAKAEPLAASAAALFHRYHGADAATAESMSRTVLARAELAQGKAAAALRAANLAAQLATQSGDIREPLTASIVQARALAAAGKVADAEKLATAALDKTKQLGLLPYQVQAEIALAEMEMSSGKTAAGRALLDAAQKEARSHGFVMLADEAKKALATR